jgi:hypothetical protein
MARPGEAVAISAICGCTKTGEGRAMAPGFYQKLGYEVFAVLEDYPRGHHNYYLRKQLT